MPCSLETIDGQVRLGFSAVLQWVIELPYVIHLGLSSTKGRREEFLSKVSEEAGTHNQEKQSILVETISGIESIKVLGGGDLVKDRWRDSATKQSSVSRISRSLAQIAVNTAQSSQQICLVGIVFYGVFLVSDGTVSMGAMVW